VVSRKNEVNPMNNKKWLLALKLAQHAKGRFNISVTTVVPTVDYDPEEIERKQLKIIEAYADGMLDKKTR
jgi:hypothetical protein